MDALNQINTMYMELPAAVKPILMIISLAIQIYIVYRICKFIGKKFATPRGALYIVYPDYVSAKAGLETAILTNTLDSRDRIYIDPHPVTYEPVIYSSVFHASPQQLDRKYILYYPK